MCEVAVYRYYCRNPQCAQGSFTNLPPGLAALLAATGRKSHLLAVQMYAWGYSTYRRTGTALGVASLTAWRWVSAWGADLLPVAALFGVVQVERGGRRGREVRAGAQERQAGGQDAALDVCLPGRGCLDLRSVAHRHLPHNNQDSAQAFLLALRAKGYHPQVIVTDLRQDYGPVIAQVFPQAVHHLCIFHALQHVQKHIKDVYGPDYAEQAPGSRAPQAADLRHLRRRHPGPGHRTLHGRAGPAPGLRPDPARGGRDLRFPGAPLAQARQQHRLQPDPGHQQHRRTASSAASTSTTRTSAASSPSPMPSATWPSSRRSIASRPSRRMPSPASAASRPLQLAGYDVASLPMTTLCAGLSIIWPMQTGEADHVPNPLR